MDEGDVGEQLVGGEHRIVRVAREMGARAVSEATALTVAVRVTDSGNGSLPAAPELVSASEESGTTTRDAPASDRPAASELPTLFPATHVSGPAGRWSPVGLRPHRRASSGGSPRR